MSVLVFNIKTIADIDSGRRLHDIHDLSDKDVANVMLHKHRQEFGHECLPTHLQKVIAISVALRTREDLSVITLGDENATEKEILEVFFSLIDLYTPNLVSWNGVGFDLPVLHYRALVHGVTAMRYWECGDQDPYFKPNNYLNRSHARHIDLLDSLAGFEKDAQAPFDEITTMLGFPDPARKIAKANVLDEYLAGNINAICNNSEFDVINLYLVYLRFEMMRGNIDKEEYQYERGVVRHCLQADNKPHLVRFIEHLTESGSQK